MATRVNLSGTNSRRVWTGAGALFLIAMSIRAGDGRSAAAQAGLPDRWLYEFGVTQAPATVLGAPAGISVAEDGSVFVFDADNDRVQRLDAEGRVLASWGRAGGGEGLFMPFSQAHPVVAPDGTVYVSDRSANRIAHFAADGTYLGGWAFAVATAAGEAQVGDVAVGADGSVYGMDVYGLATRRFAPDGTVLDVFTGVDHVRYPRYIPYPGGSDKRITVGGDGSVYVIRCTVQVLRHTAEGSFVDIVAGDGSETELIDPDWHFLDIDAAAADDSIYVLRRTSMAHSPSRVDHMAPDGRVLDSWVVPVAAGSRPMSPIASDIAVAGDGTVYLSDTANGRLMHFTADGRELGTLGTPSAPDPARAATIPGLVGVGDRVLVLDADGDRAVKVFTRAGVFLGAWGERGTLPGQIATPLGIAAAPDGSVLISDSAVRVQRFSADGEVQGRLGRTGDVPALAGPSAIAVAADGTVFVADGDYNSHIFRFGKSGEFLGHFADLDNIVAIAMVPDGALLVARAGGSDLQRFSARGEPLPSWQTGIADFRPAALTVDADGRVFAADATHRAIVVLSPDGEVAGVLRVRHPAYGTDIAPYRIAAGDGLRLLVAQSGVPGVQVLGPTLEDTWRVSWYGDRWLGGAPLAMSALPAPEADWGAGGPRPGVPTDGFSAALERNLMLPPALYRMHVSATGGARLWVGGDLLIDAWSAEQLEIDANKAVFAPASYVRLEYSDSVGAGGPRSSVRLTWTVIGEVTRAFLPRASR